MDDEAKKNLAISYLHGQSYVALPDESDEEC